MVHIVFKQSASGSLRFLYRGSAEKVIDFSAFFAEGPIQNLLTEQGLLERLKWLETCYLFTDEEKQQYKETFSRAINEITMIPKDEEVIIWTCENANEQIGLRYALKLLQNHHGKVFIANTYVNLLKLQEGSDVRFEVRHSGEVNVEQFQFFLKGKMYEQVTPEQIQMYHYELDKWLAKDCLIRTWLRGNMNFDDVTRDDALIIKYAKELHSDQLKVDYFKAPRLIGEVFGMSEYDISDTWIEYRLRQLIEKGYFLYEGDLSEMRKYSVKLKEKSQ